MSKKIGLIAGYGEFPLELTRSLNDKGFEVHVVAAREETSPEIEQLAASVCWLHVGKIGGMIKAFQAVDVKQVVMAGKVQKLHLFRNFRPDFVAVKALLSLSDRRDDSIMLKITQLLSDAGITVLSQVAYAGQMIAQEGLLFGVQPSKQQIQDMHFGAIQASGIAALDIGQTVVVQEGAVLAVEAIEGTDEAIKRGGSLGNGKAMVVKVAKPNQDLRFDVPAIGPDTLHTMHAAGCKALAVEAGCTLLIERAQLGALAKKYGLCIFGIAVEHQV
ncbi:MAG: UDP-2,3-diacylglucosamine diphosphatase LpxI [Mariprofundaceae bacterium]|nr:UDP-2,3-diacylglucosamine diphosphatase LpxI [Mariprofundaceae bacterium]